MASPSRMGAAGGRADIGLFSSTLRRWVRGRLGRRAIASLLPLVALVPNCGWSSDDASGGGRGLALVLAPAGTAAPADAVRTPAPPGSRLVSWDPDRLDEPLRTLLEGPVAAALCDVSPDGRRLLVSLQDTPGGPWRVHVLSAAGGTPQPVSPAGASAVAAAWLPGERVVLACDLAGGVDPRDGGPAFHLYTCQGDGSGLTRISFNPSSDVDPVVLPDGRILFAAWQPPGLGRTVGGFASFTVRDDGTGLAAWSGSHDGPADERRPRRLGDELVCLAGGSGSAGLLAISARRPLKARRALADEQPGHWLAAARDAHGELLLCGRPAEAGPAAPFGLYRAGAAGVQPLAVAPGVDVLDVLSLAPRTAPRGHLSTVDPEASTGELLCLDARHAELPGPGATALAGDAARATTLQVLRGRPRGRDERPGAATGPRPTPSEVLASVPLADDGSAWLSVPADTPLRFVTLDAEGRVLLDSTSWVWVRPGERRSCIGCHEDRESAPANRVPGALAGEPYDVLAAPAVALTPGLAATGGGTR